MEQVLCLMQADMMYGWFFVRKESKNKILKLHSFPLLRRLWFSLLHSLSFPHGLQNLIERKRQRRMNFLRAAHTGFWIKA